MAAGVAATGAAAVTGAAAATGTAVTGAIAAAGTAVTGAAAGAVTSAAATIGTIGNATGIAALGESVCGIGTIVGNATTTVGTMAANTAVGQAATGALSSVGHTVTSSVIGKVTAATAAKMGEAVVGSAVGEVAKGAIVAGGKVFATEHFAMTLFGAGTLATGGTAFKGFINTEEAKSIIEEAEKIYKNSNDKFEETKENTICKLEDLNKYKMKIYADDIKKSITIISKIKVPKEEEIDFQDESGDLKYYFNQNEIKETLYTSIHAKNILNEVKNGSMLIQASSMGALSIVSNFGISSTGTTISSLHGAAAKNATLAFLGGGAKAVGGGGIALGETVLGGITILPAAMIMIYNYTKASEIKLTEANRYFSDISKEVEKNNNAILLLEEAIDERINEIKESIRKFLLSYNKNMLPKLMMVYNDNKDSEGNVDYKKCSKENKEIIKLSAYYLKILKNLIAVKVLDEKGNLDNESELIVNQTNQIYIQ